MALREENINKDCLVAEANSAMEELTLEKHDMCAKLKHFLQVYV